MCNEANIAEETASVFQNALVVGNHDSITLYGIHAQNNLKDYARRITSILLKDTENSETVISELLREMERFEGVIRRPKVPFSLIRRRQKEVLAEYHCMLSYIEHVTLYLKLQQAQLTKEVKLFEHFSDAIASSALELKSCIEQGKDVLKNGTILASTSITPDDKIWYERLSKHVDDLSVSHTISLQSKAQIRILRENALRRLDQITGILSNAIPIWQSQMALVLGLDLSKAQQDIQNSLLAAGEKRITNIFTKRQRKGQTPQEWDADHILQINLSLKNVLDELAQMEVTDNSNRKTFITESYRLEGREKHAE